PTTRIGEVRAGAAPVHASGPRRQPRAGPGQGRTGPTSRGGPTGLRWADGPGVGREFCALRTDVRVRTGPQRAELAQARRGSGAEAEEVLQRQLLPAHEAVVALARLVRVALVVGGAVREPVGGALALAEGGLGELLDAGVRQRLPHLGVLAEREGALLEHQVHLHVRGGGVVLALLVLGARGLEVEVAGALVGARVGREAALGQVDGEERAAQGRSGEGRVGR